MQKYSEDIEAYMCYVFSTMHEKSQRHYAAIEALKLGHGGISYISSLLGISERTISRGIEEIKIGSDRIRRVGGGRPGLASFFTEALLQSFECLRSLYGGGDPQTGVYWTYLSIREIVFHLTQEGFKVTRKLVKKLLKHYKIGRRKIAKVETMKTVEGRNEQFEKINALPTEYASKGFAILSMDVKKKEYLGNFYRPGHHYCTQAKTSYDHDYSSFALGKMVPHGIDDLERKEGYLHLGSSADTAEFATDCLRNWWLKHGQFYYKPTNPILIICDGGGSNGSRNRLFKQQLQALASKFNLTIRIAHYPPYCSKYNPIEHQFFPFISRFWQGVKISSVKFAKKLIEQRKKWVDTLQIFTYEVEKQYEKGIKVPKDFLNQCHIVFDQELGKWNYVVNS